MKAANLMVQVIHEGDPIWSHGVDSGQRCGTSNTAFRNNGMSKQIADALCTALRQAAIEGGSTIDDCRRVLDRSSFAA